LKWGRLEFFCYVHYSRCLFPCSGKALEPNQKFQSVQLSVLLAIATALGTAVTPQLGLCSHLLQSITEKKSLGSLLRVHFVPSLLSGIAAFAIVAALDIALRPLLDQPRWQRLSQSGLSGTPASTLSGVLYGGITEELTLRWGAVSFIA
jgi:hypothetical protein